MPTNRTAVTAGVVNGKIYLIGGTTINTDETLSVFNLNEVYDPATDTWTTKAPLPTAVTTFASAVVDGKIYVIGGQEYDEPLSDCYLTQIYNAQTDSWSNGATTPNIASGAAAAATTGVYAPKRIYVLGGGTGLSHSYLNRIYDPEVDKWSYGAPMLMRTAGLGVAVVDDVLYALGAGVANERYVPVGYGTVPPVVSVLSPENNATYASGNVSLAYAVNKPYAQANYSLDGLQTAALSGNTTLMGLANGSHNVTVYATDEFGNTGASETVTFTVAQETEPQPFPTTLVIVAVIVVGAIAAAGLLFYFRKRKR